MVEQRLEGRDCLMDEAPSRRSETRQERVGKEASSPDERGCTMRYHRPVMDSAAFNLFFLEIRESRVKVCAMLLDIQPVIDSSA